MPRLINVWELTRWKIRSSLTSVRAGVYYKSQLIVHNILKSATVMYSNRKKKHCYFTILLAFEKKIFYFKWIKKWERCMTYACNTRVPAGTILGVWTRVLDCDVAGGKWSPTLGRDLQQDRKDFHVEPRKSTYQNLNDKPWANCRN